MLPSSFFSDTVVVFVNKGTMIWPMGDMVVLLQCAVSLRYVYAFGHEKTNSRRRSVHGWKILEVRSARKLFKKSLDIDCLSSSVTVISNTLRHDKKKKDAQNQ